MATTDEVIYIKQKLLAEDLTFGIKAETQVRNGISVTGKQINAEHIIYNDPGSLWHEQSVNDILRALIASTGISPEVV